MKTSPCLDAQSWKQSQAARDPPFDNPLGGNNYTLHQPSPFSEMKSPGILHLSSGLGAWANQANNFGNGKQANNFGDGNQFPWATFNAPMYFGTHHVSPASDPVQNCLQSLRYPHMDNRSKKIDPAFKGTCEWLFSNETYRRWAAHDRGLLWIKGKPGSGKSTLLHYALEDGRHVRCFDAGAVTLSYFFHGGGDKLQKTPLGLFRSLLYQILKQAQTDLPDVVSAFKERREDLGEPGVDWDWHLSELQKLFRLSLTNVLKTRSVWLFIDALDECETIEAADLVTELESLLQTLPHAASHFRICFTSRHYPIQRVACGFELYLENENQKDIETYVEAQLSGLQNVNRSAFISLITTRAAGVFIWVRLIVKYILNPMYEFMEWSEIQRLISRDLRGLYHELVQKISSKPAGLKLIQWVCFALRPLSMEELRWVLAVPADCDKMEARLKNLSYGLVEVVRSSTTTFVQFIHQSVKDYFVKEGLAYLHSQAESQGPETNDVAQNAHYELYMTCIRYLKLKGVAQSTGPDLKKVVSRFPLLQYATTSWVAHMKGSDTKLISQSHVVPYHSWPSGGFMRLWVRIYSEIYPSSQYRPPIGTTLVHVLVACKLGEPLQAVIERAREHGIKIDAKDAHGRTALLWATRSGYTTIVQLLLGKGKADADISDDCNQTPLHWAAKTGQVDTVKLLLRHTVKVAVNARDNDLRTPFMWAARGGYDAVLKLLLENNEVDINASDKDGLTSLALAAKSSGREPVIKLLLKNPQLNVNARDKDGLTSLAWAARNGCSDVAKLLLDADKVDGSIRDNDGRTPLFWAAENDREKVLQVLLTSSKIDTEAKNKDGKTLLWWAVDEWRKTVLQLLIGSGRVTTVHKNEVLVRAASEGRQALVELFIERAEARVINMKDTEYGRTPLSWAAMNGFVKVVELLLPSSADVLNARDNNGRTALALAAEEDCAQVVKQLLATGKVDIDATDDQGKTPLLLAAQNGQVYAAKLLLATGKVNVEAKDHNGATPLSRAVKNWHKAAAKLLITAGNADVDARDSYGGTLLLWASKNGHKAMARFLLRTGNANANARDNGGRTPLSWATRNGHATVTQLLIEAKADVDLQDNYGRTPLHWAARNGRGKVVKLLLGSANIAINAKDEHGWTPLSWAARRGYTEMVNSILGQEKVDINSRDEYKRTPLLWAARNGHEQAVKLLLDANADVTLTESYGRAPFGWAVRNGHEKVIEQLLATRLVESEAEDKYGRTPFSWAAANGHIEAAELLITVCNADINAVDVSGRTPLSYAAENGQRKLVDLILTKDPSSINAKDKLGRTPLCWAAENSYWNMPVINFLLTKGQANIDVNSPLAHAAADGRTEVVRLLLGNRAVDVNTLDRRRRTPLAHAAANGHVEVVRLLLSNRVVNVNAPDNRGRTPLSWAAGNGHKDVVALLLQRHRDGSSAHMRRSWMLCGAQRFWGLGRRRGRVDVWVQDCRGRTALWHAQQGRHESVAALLVQSKL